MQRMWLRKFALSDSQSCRPCVTTRVGESWMKCADDLHNVGALAARLESKHEKNCYNSELFVSAPGYCVPQAAASSGSEPISALRETSNDVHLRDLCQVRRASKNI